MGINKETGEITYPYLDDEGRVVIDPKPLVAPVQITQIGLDDNRIPNSLIQGWDVDDDGIIDDESDLGFDDQDVLPLTQFELAALRREEKEEKAEERAKEAQKPVDKAPEGGVDNPPLEPK